MPDAAGNSSGTGTKPGIPAETYNRSIIVWKLGTGVTAKVSSTSGTLWPWRPNLETAIALSAGCHTTTHRKRLLPPCRLCERQTHCSDRMSTQALPS